MKKALLLVPVLALAACDKPTSTADLTCTVDKYWQISNALYLNDSYYEYGKDNEAKVDVKVVTYDDYAYVTADGITRKFERVSERKDRGEFGYVGIIYKGNFPGSERTALLDIYANITTKQILQYTLTFIGQKTKNEQGREFSVGHSCYPVKENDKGDSWSSKVAFNHHYKMPNKTERCITGIVEKVFCENEECTKLSVFEEGKTRALSQQEALALSSNWNYKNMKYYRNDGKLEEHEKDACEVLERVNKFIDDNDIGARAYHTIQQAMDDCGDDCSAVIAKGEMGDFLIQLPETEELRKIANKKKNAKFLSVFNPNSYTKTGYCLVNVVPYNTMKQMGTPDNNCHYRIYCGAPEYMNYDEFYAVEVCN